MRPKGAGRIHPWHLGMVVVSLAVLGVITFAGSCQQADRIISDVNAVAGTGQAVLDSPAGQMIPPDIRLYGSLVISAVMAGAAGYKQWRLAQMGKTTKAIVRGIEAAEKQPMAEASGNPVSPIKAAIGTEMRRLGIYDTGNKIVERLKVS